MQNDEVPVSYAIDREQYRSTLMETKKPVYDLEERTVAVR